MGDLTEWGASLNILKGLIGLGVLTLPYATKQVGAIPSVVGMAIVAFMTVWGTFFAVMAKDKLQQDDDLEIREQTTLFNKKDSGAATALSPECSGLGFFNDLVGRVLGWPAQWLCSASIVICQLGTAVAYINAISESVESYLPEGNWRALVLVALGVALTMLSAVRTLQGVSVLSGFGLLIYLLIFAALVAQTFSEAAQQTLGSTAALAKYQSAHYSQWFGICNFAFGVFAIAIVVYDDMQRQRNFFKVTTWSFAACWAFYSLFALLGYLCYGEGTEEIIYFNFAERSPIRHVSLLSICLILLLSYVLQMMPIYSYAQQNVDLPRLHYSVLRGMLVALTVVLAYLLPSVTFMLEVVGAISAVVSSFVLPPIVYLKVAPNAAASEYVLALSLIVFGLAGLAKVII